ncbi:Ltp family lipoprotein [Microbacterium sp. GXF7504]
MTDNITAPLPPTPESTPGTEKKPWYKRKPIIIPVAVVGGIIVLAAIGSAMGGGDNSSEADTKPAAVAEAAETTVPDTVGKTAKEAAALIENAGLKVDFSASEGVVIDRDNWVVLSTTPAAGETLAAGAKVVVNVEKIAKEVAENSAAEPAAPQAPAAPSMTLGQSNAVRSAESYLRMTGFSRTGLYEQLTSPYGEGYDGADAEFALSYLEQNGKVDWNQEAVESAQSYLNMTSFSRQGLYEQLTSEYGEAFTPEQAEYALSQVGY